MTTLMGVCWTLLRVGLVLFGACVGGCDEVVVVSWMDVLVVL